MTPNLRNALRWIIAIGVSVAIGAISAMTDAHAGMLDYLRHGALACVPTLLALKATLEKELGVAPVDPKP
jgi:hypothetical protein